MKSLPCLCCTCFPARMSAYADTVLDKIACLLKYIDPSHTASVANVVDEVVHEYQYDPPTKWLTEELVCLAQDVLDENE